MNDLLYNEIVATPGYVLDFAVGTTYSLDAEVFLALALSFGRLGEINSRDFDNPLRLLEGIRKVSSRVALFCNRGGFKVPPRTNPLFAMLDSCVFEVADERRHRELANFHPKVWLIRERRVDNDRDRQLKLIVLSRNLTTDTSLDVALSMTAPLGRTAPADVRAKHAPLKEWLSRLAGFASAAKRRDILRLAADIDKAALFGLDDRFCDYDFAPLHFGENLNGSLNLDAVMTGKKTIVVSPFIAPETLDALNRAAKNSRVLITRLESLSDDIMRRYADSDGAEVWVPTALMSANDIAPMNLHAKMYYMENPPSQPAGSYLWLGSANATPNGFHRNSEFLVCLHYRRSINLFDKFKAEFCNPDKQMFERVVALPEGASAQTEPDRLSVALRSRLICRNNLSAEVVSHDDGSCEVVLTSRRKCDSFAQITFAPLQAPHCIAEWDFETRGCVMTPLAALQLSEFYILTATDSADTSQTVSMVIKIPTSGIPRDRDDLIFQHYISSPDKFIDYMAMIVSDTPQEMLSLMCAAADSAAAGGSVDARPARASAMYESLLRIAATDPARLNDISDFIGRLDSAVIPDSFSGMYSQFRRALKELK